MTSNQITIRCPNSKPDFMRVTVMVSLNTIIIERGRMAGTHFTSTSIERLEMGDPDVAGLFTDEAWDIEKLYQLADFYCVEDDAARTTDQDARAAVQQ